MSEASKPYAGVSPKPDTKHLQRRHNTWLAVVAVPRSLQLVIGKPKVIRSLKTGDLKTAQRRRHAVVACFMATIDAARQVTEGGPQTLAAEALELSTLIEAAPERADGDSEAYSNADLIYDSAEPIARAPDCTLTPSFGPSRASPSRFGAAKTLATLAPAVTRGSKGCLTRP